MSAAEIQQPPLGAGATGAAAGKATRRERREELVRHVEYCPFPRARPARDAGAHPISFACVSHRYS
jgi:hypothetical protein